MRDKIIAVIKKNDYLFFIIKYWRLRFLMFFGTLISDKKYIEFQYRSRTHKKLKLDPPITFNEKIQHYKLNYRNQDLKRLVDKYAVRSYVQDKIGEEYLTKLYGIYNNVNDIPFDSLGDKFVMKLTNGSGFNYICSSKTEKDIKKIKARFKKWVKLDFYMLGREWAYKDVPNRIICEEYIESKNPQGLNDYKIFCFNGEPKIIQVDFSRFLDHKRNFYSPEWEFIDEKVAYDNDPSINIEKPKNLDDMLRCARELSKGFPQVRVDFYSEGDRLIFGEMTFYHGAGYLKFENEDFEKTMGDYWSL